MHAIQTFEYKLNINGCKRRIMMEIFVILRNGKIKNTLIIHCGQNKCNCCELVLHKDKGDIKSALFR